MQGKHSSKIVVLTILFLLSAAMLFSSDTRQDGISFRFLHEVHVDSSFYSEYRTPGTGTKITEVQFGNPGTYRFATLVIGYNKSMSFTSISLSFGPLLHNMIEDAYYDYSMLIFDPGYNSVLAEVVPDNDIGHGAGSVVFSNVTLLKPANSGLVVERELVDFEITLDDSEAMAGTYSGNITCVFTK